MTPDNPEAIRRGRACVRLIEAADVLLETANGPHERVVIGEAREMAKAKLRELVADLDPTATAQIFAASDRRLGTVGDVGLN